MQIISIAYFVAHACVLLCSMSKMTQNIVMLYCSISILTNEMAAFGVIQSQDIWVTWSNATMPLVPFGIGLII